MSAVYFAQAGPYVKIGHSRDPIARMTTVTISGTRPADLPRGADARLIGWVPGTTWDEGIWHARFAADRVAGEWFYLDASLIHELIWADPAGIDVVRMSALAVFAADKYRGATREQIAAAGFQIEATPVREAILNLGRTTAIRNPAA